MYLFYKKKCKPVLKKPWLSGSETFLKIKTDGEKKLVLKQTNKKITTPHFQSNRGAIMK